MKEGFRQCMAWLHTWTGLVVGWILFFVFLTGTTGYVKDEINRWMQPERPMQQANYAPTAQQLTQALTFLSQHDDAKHVERWGINLQNAERGHENLELNWSLPAKEGEAYGAYGQATLDTTTGQPYAGAHPPRATGGGQALFTLHYTLHYIPYDWGIRIVGICTMFMFVALISGIITHKKIFKDFFTFRSGKGQRSWLDAHNVLGVIALPFYLMVTYSGLIFFLNAYMPLGVPSVYGFGAENEQRYYQDVYPEYYPDQVKLSENQAPAKSISLSTLAPTEATLTQLIAKTDQYWGQNQVSGLNVYSATQYSPMRVNMQRQHGHEIMRPNSTLEYIVHADGSTAFKDKPPKPVSRVVADTFVGLHVGYYASALIRWMYVITGLIGTAMIATGLVLWTVKRRPKQLKASKMSFAHGLVERLNIGMITGLPLGLAMYFWANRLLPVSLETRAGWEMHALFLSILFAWIYAYLRPIPRAWLELLSLIAVAYLLLPILNALTTDRHLWATAQAGDWGLFSIDLGFILFGLIFAGCSYFVWRKRHSILQSPVASKKQKSASMTAQQTIPESQMHNTLSNEDRS